MKVVHIASIRMSEETGMGRIAWHWRNAFEARGHEFIHIGNDECPQRIHNLLWGRHVRQYMKKRGIEPDLLLVHEPAAGYFVNQGVPVVVFSHGIERRGWAIEAKYGYRHTTLKSLFLPDAIRYGSNTKGLKNSKSNFTRINLTERYQIILKCL